MSKQNIRVGCCLVVLCAIVSIMVIQLPSVAYAYAEESQSLEFKQENIVDFITENQTIEHENTITDFNNNIFKIYELSPTGHAIYSITDDSSIFLEGSYEDNSPYIEHYQHEIYYVGPGDYYCIEDSKIINLITNEIVEYENIPHTYQIKSEYYLKTNDNIQSRASFPSKPDTDKTHVENGFTVINNDDYFRNLTQFPSNTQGTCGLVAICILLGYFDNYVNGDFITDSSFVLGNGTTQAMHDYLFDECKHTILGAGGKGGYPMAGYEIQETMKDYLSKKCSTNLQNRVKHEYGSIFYTHANPRKHINGGYPTLIVLSSYDKLTRNKGEKDKHHIVVAYGYNKKNDTFLAHMGWGPGDNEYTSRIISNATIHSYYTINYT